MIGLARLRGSKSNKIFMRLWSINEVYIIIVRTRQKWNYDVQTGLQTHYIQLSSQIISSTFVNIQHHQVINSIMSHRGPKVVICLSNQHIT